ncbi:MAG TPA: hypothetical protein ENG63_00950 [Candidatus Desulfofervidus auxilii]|uniref:Uncharacterized protein n=1 Tax=Desulfofervidus auxilii TaxID=1621989 RepID=A0A7C0Y3E2_DESA2|nr:hypothetical protein [Candidatus Desulfofervidus auxilii]
MKTQKKLIRLMKEKAKVIQEITGIDYYFVKEDEKDILEWEDGIAEMVWIEIKRNVFEQMANGLSSDVCPYCIKQSLLFLGLSKCVACEYGSRHGFCYQIGSDFNKIISNKKLSISRFLTNDWYKKIINNIEKEV